MSKVLSLNLEWTDKIVCLHCFLISSIIVTLLVWICFKFYFTLNRLSFSLEIWFNLCFYCLSNVAYFILYSVSFLSISLSLSLLIGFDFSYKSLYLRIFSESKLLSFWYLLFLKVYSWFFSKSSWFKFSNWVRLFCSCTILDWRRSVSVFKFSISFLHSLFSSCTDWISLT